MSFDTATLLFFLGVWPVWLGWELVLLWKRGRGGNSIPKTLSMVARDRGPYLNSVEYVWGGLATHFWWPSSTWASAAGSVAFWAGAAVLLVSDIVLWRSDREGWPRVLRVLRSPLLWLVVGALAGRLMFPQAGHP